MAIWRECVRMIVISACVLGAPHAAVCKDSSITEGESAKASIASLTAITSKVDGIPQWSPNGSRIMFESSFGKPGLWAINPGGGTPSLLFADDDI